jgi:hypothetical protein
MSRHRHRKQREYYDDRDGEGQERPLPRRKSGNEGLYIALGVAAVIGLVFILIMTGSSSDEEDTGAALVVLQELFRTCLEDRKADGAKLLVAREILRDQNTNETKIWSSLSPERRAELELQAFNWIRGRIIQDLQLIDMNQVNNLLRASEAVPFGGDNRVDFQWVYASDRWNASLVRVGENWKVQRLDRQDG